MLSSFHFLCRVGSCSGCWNKKEFVFPSHWNCWKIPLSVFYKPSVSHASFTLTTTSVAVKWLITHVKAYLFVFFLHYILIITVGAPYSFAFDESFQFFSKLFEKCWYRKWYVWRRVFFIPVGDSTFCVWIVNAMT